MQATLMGFLYDGGYSVRGAKFLARKPAKCFKGLGDFFEIESSANPNLSLLWIVRGWRTGLM